MVDADGNPLPTQPVDPLAPQPDTPAQGAETQRWLDEVLRRNPDNRAPPPPQQQPRQLPPQQRVAPATTRPPQPSDRPADPLQPRP